MQVLVKFFEMFENCVSDFLVCHWRISHDAQVASARGSIELSRGPNISQNGLELKVRRTKKRMKLTSIKLTSIKF